jgi:hypothetical protein
MDEHSWGIALMIWYLPVDTAVCVLIIESRISMLIVCVGDVHVLPCRRAPCFLACMPSWKSHFLIGNGVNMSWSLFGPPTPDSVREPGSHTSETGCVDSRSENLTESHFKTFPS